MKTLLKFVIAVILSFGLFIAGFYAGVYSSFYVFGTRAEQEVKKLAKTLKLVQKQDLERKMADTYGGKTPQETLQMFISAVEKGDYELASKYFVEEKRKKELEKLQNATRDTIINIIQIFKTLKLVDKTSIIEKMYDENLKKYKIPDSKEDYLTRIKKIYENQETMSASINGYDFTINFIRYPNNIWKLTDI